VNGYAISGGFELALACDLRFCSPNAEFALQDAKWGFHACDGGLIRLPQIVGLGHAMHIILSGERVGAEEAYRIGLVNRVVPQPELLGTAIEYAQMLAKRSPLSHRFAKEVVKRAVGLPMDEALRLESRSFHDVGLTDDLAEGTASFRERREAEFKGR
jgi:enoyl-CoA hydratase/carnithine racemase